MKPYRRLLSPLVGALAVALAAVALTAAGCAPRNVSRHDQAGSDQVKPDKAGHDAVGLGTVGPGTIRDLRTDVCYLASDSLEGRLVGTAGIEEAAAYIADRFKQLGLAPLFGDSYYQEFPIEFGFTVEGRPVLKIGEAAPDYSVLPISGSGTVWGGSVVARSLTAAGGSLAGKVIFYLENPALDGERWTTTGRDGLLEWMRGAARQAGDLEAGAIVFVSGTPANPDAGFHFFAVPRVFDPAPLPCLEITYSALANAVESAGGGSASLLAGIRGDSTRTWRELPNLQSELGITTGHRTISVKNVGALIKGTATGAAEYVVVGAHYDHLGMGDIASMTPWRREVHNGADDNASGVGAVLEVARRLVSQPRTARSIALVAFTAEELGAVGSEYFCKHAPFPIERTIAMINLDTVGRLEANQLIVFGAKSAMEFGDMLAGSDSGIGLGLVEKQEIFGFSDQNPFYSRHIPSLHLFTGANSDYHTPEDDCTKINFEGLGRIAAFAAAMAMNVASSALITPVIVEEKPSQGAAVRGRGGFLGIVPDFTYDGEGIRIKGSVPKSPAETAGLETGDILVAIDGEPLADLQQLMTVLSGKSPGDVIAVEVRRGQSTLTEQITLSVRSAN